MKHISIAVTVVLSLIIAVYVASVVLADHRIYLYEDPSHTSPRPGYENTIVYNWAINGTDVTWYAPIELRSDVRTAILRWEHYFDPLGWTESQTRTGVENVLFEYTTCNDGAPGSFLPVDWESVGDANYVKKARICINSTESFAVNSRYNARVATISHEIGHLHGLDERYRDSDDDETPIIPNVCNNDETSIMDGAKYALPNLLNLKHCDEIEAPWTSTDVPRVRSLYAEGGLEEFTVSPNSDTLATSTNISWVDVAWAESEHRIKLNIYDHDARNWFYINEYTVAEGIGTHRDIPGTAGNRPYELSLTFSPEEHSSMEGHRRLPDRAAYRYCGTPYFLPFNSEAPIRQNNCSESVLLIIPHGELVASSSSIPVNGTLPVHLTGLVPNDLSHFTVKLSGPISSSDECAEADEYVRGLATFTITGCAIGTGKVTLQTRRYALTAAELDITVGDPTGTLRLAPGQPTRIRYGQTLSLVASELSHDTSAYKLRLYHPFAPEDADCDTHLQDGLHPPLELHC